MNIRPFITAITVTIAAFSFSGCATLPRPNNQVVGIDVRHGHVWPGLVETLASNGYKAVIISLPLDSATLEKIGVLLIAAPSSTYKVAELDAIQHFVKSGGGLLCAGQAWSWTYPQYGNKPIHTYPLNIIGRRLNFWITEHARGAPVHFGTEIMAGIAGVERSDWWPSEVVVNDRSGKAIMKDEQHKTVGALQHFGRGKMVIFGHDGILKENPRILIQSLNFTAGLP